MSEILKKCPFCGGSKVAINWRTSNAGDSYHVYCRYTDCHGEIYALGCKKFKTKEEAIQAWNTRSREQKLIEALKEAKDGLADFRTMTLTVKQGESGRDKVIIAVMMDELAKRITATLKELEE